MQKEGGVRYVPSGMSNTVQCINSSYGVMGKKKVTYESCGGGLGVLLFKRHCLPQLIFLINKIFKISKDPMKSYDTLPMRNQ